jgi:hypothetical protein
LLSLQKIGILEEFPLENSRNVENLTQKIKLGSVKKNDRFKDIKMDTILLHHRPSRSCQNLKDKDIKRIKKKESIIFLDPPRKNCVK